MRKGNKPQRYISYRGGKMTKGPAKSIRTWPEFLSHSWEEQKEILGNMHGGQHNVLANS